MLLPPRAPAQMATVQWGLPLLAAFSWLMWCELRTGLGGLVGAIVGTAAAVIAWCWAVYAGGISSFGSAHGLAAPPLMALLWIWPLSTALLPRVLPGYNSGYDWACALVHLAVAAAAAAWHRACAGLGTADDTGVLQWPALTVDVTRRRLRAKSMSGQTWWQAPAAGSALAVICYGLMGTWVGWSARAVCAAAAMNALALALYLGPLGRTFGQAWRLRQFEQQLAGKRFMHNGAVDLSAWRAAHGLYRYFRHWV